MDARISLALNVLNIPDNLHSRYNGTIDAKLKLENGDTKLTMAKLETIEKASFNILSYLAPKNPYYSYIPNKSYVPYEIGFLISSVVLFAYSFFALGVVCLGVSIRLHFHKFFDLSTNEKKLCETIPKHIHALTLLYIFQEVLTEESIFPSQRDEQGIPKLILQHLIQNDHRIYLSATPTIGKTHAQISELFSKESDCRTNLIAQYNLLKSAVDHQGIAILFCDSHPITALS